VTLTQVIETGDGYILIGEFRPDVQPGIWAQVTGVPLIHDANGKKVPYTFPLDIQPPDVNDGSGGYGFAFEFRSAGLAYPLTLTFYGVNVSPADPEATAEFEFDFGPDPQPGQEWTPNLEIELAGHTLKLVSIATNWPDCYSFEFLTDPRVNDAGLEIEGHVAMGGGGGGEPTDGKFSLSLAYEHPTGRVTILLSNLTVVSDPLTWQGLWSPASPADRERAEPTPQPGLCLSSESLDQVPAAPPGLFRGLALVYEQLEGSEDWGLVLQNLEGGDEQVLVRGTGWGALSPDGSQLAYSAADGIRIKDIAGGRILTEAVGGYGMHWSPDGSQIATSAGLDRHAHPGRRQRGPPDLRPELRGGDRMVVGWSRGLFCHPFTGGAAGRCGRSTPPPGLAHLFIIETAQLSLGRPPTAAGSPVSQDAPASTWCAPTAKRPIRCWKRSLRGSAASCGPGEDGWG
jgi:hypothetical protein